MKDMQRGSRVEQSAWFAWYLVMAIMDEMQLENLRLR
jgi:hypothetical protein